MKRVDIFALAHPELVFQQYAGAKGNPPWTSGPKLLVSYNLVCRCCCYLYMNRRTALADETETAQRNIEDKQRIHCNANAIPDHARTSHDADSCGQRPSYENEVHGHSNNDGYANSAEE
jgi:hypothetical protein